MEPNNVLDDDLFTNMLTRIPICLCIDTYDSKESSIIVKGITEEITEFYKKIKQDFSNANSTEISIVGSGNNAYVVQEFTTVAKAEYKFNFNIEGKGNIGSVILKGLSLLDKRKKLYHQYGIDYHKPILIILATNPEEATTTEEFIAAYKATTSLEVENKLSVLVVYLGDHSSNETDKLIYISSQPGDNLKVFSNKNEPQILGSTRIDLFFKWLATTIREIAYADDGIIDVTYLQDWEII